MDSLASRLEADLRAVTHDKHVRVQTRGAPPPADAPRRVASEFGLARADRLKGGIGYIDLVGFPSPELFRPSADKAMALVADSRALIIDLRHNGGGSPASVAYLVSFFVSDDKPVHLNDVVRRQAGTETFTTESFFSSPTPTKYLGRPVYLLTSGDTFSGGEEFAYDLQALKRATVVGSTTGGGANPGGGLGIGSGLMLNVPSGRAENPITKTNWEGKGVAPDVSVPADQALATALGLLGQPKVAAVDAASEQALFKPRTTPQPGAKEALTRIIDEVVRGAPDYGRMSEPLARATRQQLPDLRQTLILQGALKTVTFVNVDPAGADVYDAIFEQGAVRWTIAVAPDGKVLLAGFRPIGSAPRP